MNRSFALGTKNGGGHVPISTRYFNATETNPEQIVAFRPKGK